MAIMIPNNFSPDIKSHAEMNVFKWFSTARGTENWIVLHSLGISKHQRVIHGETDFLVLAPGLGMFALEVKGGRVQRTLGKWRYINRYGDITEKVRGPFDQAWEGIYSIKNSLETKIDNNHEYLKNIIFGIGVMFPDIEYDAIGVDEEAWQVFDINDGKDVKKYIERIAEGTVNNLKRLKYEVTDIMFPSNEDVNYILEILRGDFDLDIPLRIKQRYTENELLELTNEQSLCIEQLEDNHRAVIRGIAGTGKTLLAIEAAKRALARGENIAFFCYNRLLGEWLEDLFSSAPLKQRPAFVGTFHSFMLKQITKYRIEYDGAKFINDSKMYFETVLPDALLNCTSDWTQAYDRIIIDEAQDLVTEKYLDIMDRCLKNGFVNGKWIMFGDFSMQAIYSGKATEAIYIEQIQKRTSFAIFRLTKNCRNTRKICLDIENIIGIPENAAFEDKIDTPFVDHRIYHDMEDQKRQLIMLLSELANKNIQEKDIVILSPRRQEDSVVGLLDGIVVEKYSIQKADRIRFSTIQAFKGLESSTVIMTDIESYKDEKLIYVGLSRARFDLHIFETTEAAAERNQLFIKRRLSNVR